jgi:hypothetical protein
MTVSYLATPKGAVKPEIAPEIHDNSLTIQCKSACVLIFYIHTATKVKLIWEVLIHLLASSNVSLESRREMGWTKLAKLTQNCYPSGTNRI